MRYFVDDERRLVRTWADPKNPPAVWTETWREVSSDEYDLFRKETRKLKPAELRKLRGLL